MYEEIDNLEERVNTVLPNHIKTLIECRSNFYAELASGWDKNDLRKAADAYIQAMLTVLAYSNKLCDRRDYLLGYSS